MRPRRPHHTSATICLILLLPLLLAWGTGCTVDHDMTPPAEALAMYEGKPVTWGSATRYAEFRTNLLQIRQNYLYGILIDEAFANSGLTLDPDFARHQFERQYRLFAGGDPSISLADAERMFREQFKIGELISEEVLQSEILRFAKMLTMLSKDQPLTDAVVRQHFDQMEPELQFRSVQQIYGWQTLEEVNFEQAKQEFRTQLGNQLFGPQIPEFVAGLYTSAIRDHKLLVNWFPGEQYPHIEGWQDLPREQKIEADHRRLRDELGKLGYTGPMSEVGWLMHYDSTGTVEVELWDEFLSRHLVNMRLGEVPAQLLNFLAIEYAFKAEKLELDQEMLQQAVKRQLEAMGGEEGLQGMLPTLGITRQEWEDQIRRDIMLKQLVLQVNPITEAELRERYSQNSPAIWYQAYKQMLNLQTPGDATFGRLRPYLREDLINSAFAKHSKEYLAKLQEVLEERQILVKVSPDGTSAKPLRPVVMIQGLPAISRPSESVASALHLPLHSRRGPQERVVDAPADSGGHDAHDGHGH